MALISLKDNHFSLKISLLFNVLSDRKFEWTLMTFKQLYWKCTHSVLPSIVLDNYLWKTIVSYLNKRFLQKTIVSRLFSKKTNKIYGNDQMELMFFERVLKKKNEMGSSLKMKKRNFKNAERALLYSNLNLYFWSHKSKTQSCKVLNSAKSDGL